MLKFVFSFTHYCIRCTLFSIW